MTGGFPRLTLPELGLGSSEHRLTSPEHGLGSSEHRLASGEHGLESSAHGLPFPWARDCKERTNRSQISVCWKIIRPIPSHNIPKTRRRFLLLPGGEGRDEGGRSNYSCFLKFTGIEN